jgi:hypothetical protein
MNDLTVCGNFDVDGIFHLLEGPTTRTHWEMAIKYPRPPPAFWRLNSLNEEKAALFKTTHNPKALRLGNKILKSRMRAQAIENYYPQDFKFTPRILGRLFPGLTFQDDDREQWEEDVEE